MINKKIIILYLTIFLSFYNSFSSELNKESNQEFFNRIIRPIEIQEIISKYIGWQLTPLTNKLFINNLAISWNGKWLAASANFNCIKLWDISELSNIKCVNTFSFKEKGNIHFDLSPDGKYLALGIKDKIKIYYIQDSENIKEAKFFNFPHNHCPTQIKFSADSNYLFATNKSLDGENVSFNFNHKVGLFIINIQDRKDPNFFTFKQNLVNNSPNPFNNICCSKNGQYLATFDNKDIVIWDSKDLPNIKKCATLSHYSQEKESSQSSLQFSSNSKYLGVQTDSYLKIWDLSNIQEVKKVYENKGEGTGQLHFDFHPQSQYLILSDFHWWERNGTISFLDLRDINSISSYNILNIPMRLTPSDNTPINRNWLSNPSLPVLFSSDGNTIFFADRSSKTLHALCNFERKLNTAHIKIQEDLKKYACNYCKIENSKELLKICSICRKVRYCNISCQKTDWHNHKGNCR